MPRFVVLFHETPADDERPSHWDFMLEAQSALQTWALADEPRPGVKIKAEALPDHRLAYLDYEGPVSDQRGQVSRWDAGDYAVLAEGDGELRIQLAGDRLCGVVTLTRKAVVGIRWNWMLD